MIVTMIHSVLMFALLINLWMKTTTLLVQNVMMDVHHVVMESLAMDVMIFVALDAQLTIIYAMEAVSQTQTGTIETKYVSVSMSSIGHHTTAALRTVLYVVTQSVHVINVLSFILATSVKLDVLMEHMFPEVQGSALVPQDGLASLAKSRAILIASLVLKLMKTYVQTAEEIRLEMNVSFAYQIGLLRVTALLSVLMALMLKVTQGLALVILDGRRPTVIHHAIAFAIPACRRIQKHVQNVPEIRPYRNVTCAFLIGSMTIVKLCAMRVKAFTYMVLVASVPA